MLESALAQTVADLAVVVIDDAGPCPEAADLVQGLHDARFTYQRNDRNLGLAGNWNRCLEAARTELVTLVHADDELQPGYAQAMLAAAARWPEAAAFFCQARIIDADGRPAASFPDLVKRYLIPSVREPVVLHGAPALARVLQGNFIMCPTLCYRMSRIAGRRFAPRWRMVLDLDFIAALLLDGETLVGLPDQAYSYRRHANNQTTELTVTLVRFEEEARIYDELAQRCRDKGWARAAAVARRKTIIYLNLAYCALQDSMQGRFKSAQSKLLFLSTLATGKIQYTA